MKIVASKATAWEPRVFTYYGDGSWNKKARRELGFNFVLVCVGNLLTHAPNIVNFEPINRVLSCIGL